MDNGPEREVSALSLDTPGNRKTVEDATKCCMVAAGNAIPFRLDQPHRRSFDSNSGNRL